MREKTDQQTALADQPRQKLRVQAWKLINKGALLGLATVEASLLTIFDCPVLTSHGKIWVALPGRPQIDAEGRHQIGPDGKKAHVPAMKWRSKEIGDRFSTAVIEALREAGIVPEDGAA
jgi:hypothetical protein